MLLSTDVPSLPGHAGILGTSHHIVLPPALPHRSPPAPPALRCPLLQVRVRHRLRPGAGLSGRSDAGPEPKQAASTLTLLSALRLVCTSSQAACLQRLMPQPRGKAAVTKGTAVVNSGSRRRVCTRLNTPSCAPCCPALTVVYQVEAVLLQSGSFLLLGAGKNERASAQQRNRKSGKGTGAERQSEFGAGPALLSRASHGHSTMVSVGTVKWHEYIVVGASKGGSGECGADLPVAQAAGGATPSFFGTLDNRGSVHRACAAGGLRTLR